MAAGRAAAGPCPLESPPVPGEVVALALELRGQAPRPQPPSRSGSLSLGRRRTSGGPRPPALTGAAAAAAQNREYGLLGAAREAVLAPVLSPWQELADEQGKPYFYNRTTKVSSRRHPLDSKFSKLVHALRREGGGEGAAGTGTWMKFQRAAGEGKDGKGEGEGAEYWYDFKTGRSAAALPRKAEQVPGVPADRVPQYDAYMLTRKPFMSNEERVANLEFLTFKSWWYDNKEEASLGDGSTAGGGLKKRYATVRFDLKHNTFDVILEDAALMLSGLASLTAKRKQPVQCWDLHVGAKVNLLGKATTLNQCNGETLEWLEFHATQLKKLKERLDACLGKYQSRSLPAAIRFDKGHRRGRLDRDALSPGGTSLRSMLDQIQQLIGAVGHFRPSLAEKFAVQLEAITGLGMHPEKPDEVIAPAPHEEEEGEGEDADAE